VTVLGLWDSEPGVPVLGVWDSERVWALAGDSEPGVPVLGIWDSEAVWALARKTSIAPTAATVSKKPQRLRKADMRTPSPRRA
jgi:hypothetical protein